jgi:hypothetical protein
MINFEMTDTPFFVTFCAFCASDDCVDTAMVHFYTEFESEAAYDAYYVNDPYLVELADKANKTAIPEGLFIDDMIEPECSGTKRPNKIPLVMPPKFVNGCVLETAA